MIHLDTSFLIHAMVPSSPADRRLRGWLRSGDDLAISSVAWAEFLCGPVEGLDIELVTSLFGEIVPYTVVDSETTARLFNVGGRRRGSLADCMIAAVAVRSGASLATVNPSDFKRLGAAGPVIVEP
jgi:predicted nucleic acid-binding protein